MKQFLQWPGFLKGFHLWGGHPLANKDMTMNCRLPIQQFQRMKSPKGWGDLE